MYNRFSAFDLTFGLPHKPAIVEPSPEPIIEQACEQLVDAIDAELERIDILNASRLCEGENENQ
jgi:hypothetical protein